MNNKQVEIGAANRKAVRALLRENLGISRKEIGQRLGLSAMAVTRHVTAIRAEWGGESLPTKRGLVGVVETFQSYGCPVCSGDCAAANPPVSLCPMQIARTAVEAAKKEMGE